MTTRFQTIERRMSAAVDRLHAERTRVVPTDRNGFASAASTLRTPYIATGVIDMNPVTTLVRSQSRYEGDAASVSADRVHVSYDVAALPAQNLWPRRGDEIEFMDRDNEPRIKVNVVEPDGLGRVVIRGAWISE